MSPDPRIIQLGSMLDDPDDRIAVDLIARLMLFSDDELGELPAVMQESSNPAVRRRAQWLQHALNMRRRRRRIRELMGNGPSGMAVIQTLLDLHLLWFDKDSPDDIESEVEEFIQAALPGVTGSLDDLELQLRKLTVFPENETTIRIHIQTRSGLYAVIVPKTAVGVLSEIIRPLQLTRVSDL